MFKQNHYQFIFHKSISTLISITTILRHLFFSYQISKFTEVK